MKAYKPYSQNPDSPIGIPANYPWQVQDCKTEDVEKLSSENFIVCSEIEYENLLSSLKEEFDLWYSPSKMSNFIPDVLPRQMRQALILSGISTDLIDGAINQMPEPLKSLSRAEWQFSLAFQRNNKLVNEIGNIVGKTKEQLDDIWILAGKL